MTCEGRSFRDDVIAQDWSTNVLHVVRVGTEHAACNKRHDVDVRAVDDREQAYFVCVQCVKRVKREGVPPGWEWIEDAPAMREGASA